MSKAWELYNDSYIKGMKRPDFWGFKPDDASGSSMLFRSEETNPWANRDQSNAKFGPMGNKGSILQGSGGGGGSGFSMGSMPSTPAAGMGGGPTGRNQSTLDGLVKMGGGMLAQKGMNYGMNKGAGYLKDLWSSGVSGVPAGAADAYLQGGTTGMEALLEGGGDAASAYLDAGTAGLESMAESGMDAASGASGAVPFVGPALRLGKDAATGELMRSPGKSIGGAGGALAGALAGQALIPIPGVGAAIGAIAGGLGGKALGGLFGGGGGGGGSVTPPAPGPENISLPDLVKAVSEGEGTRIVDSGNNDLWDQFMKYQDNGQDSSDYWQQLMNYQNTGDYGYDYAPSDWSVW